MHETSVSLGIATNLNVGCYFSLKDYKKTQELFDTIPSLLEKKKINGKDLPTEVFIKKKCERLRNVNIVFLWLIGTCISGILQAETEMERRG